MTQLDTSESLDFFARLAQKFRPDVSALRGEERMAAVNDVLFLYTDGASDATNVDEKMFSMERLAEALQTCRGKRQKVFALPSWRKSAPSLAMPRNSMTSRWWR